jgi:hypothetical protein
MKRHTEFIDYTAKVTRHLKRSLAIVQTWKGIIPEDFGY